MPDDREARTPEVTSVPGADIVDCLDFMLVKRICVGDKVMVRASNRVLVGKIKTLSLGGAMVIENDVGKDIVVRFRYVAYLEVLERAGDSARPG